MDKFLEMYKLPILNEEETENMDRLIIGNEIGISYLKKFLGVPVMAQWK